ncbi:MAG: hypothetical protein IK115_07945 [Lachnospiraceae bacterium]|nr:hypothetical protein [Lachnospiraceae bacterium]
MREDGPGNVEIPVFFTDLNLDQILERVTEGWGEDVRKLYLNFPADREDEEYRRAVYGDVKKEGVLSALTEYYASIRQRRNVAERREKAYEELQQQVWYLRETYTYAAALDTLYEKLNAAELSSEGMKGLAAFVKSCISEDSYREMKEEMLKLWTELSSFRVLLTYEKERFTLSEGKGEGEFEAFLAENFPGQSREFKSPFLDIEYFSKLEEEIVKLFRKKHKGFFKSLRDFCTAYPEYLHEGLGPLENEIAFYLSYAKFQRKMQEKGFAFCAPGASADKLSATGLYDLALALVNMEAGKEVVPNEAYLAADEDFFVLTGPNQGGKTTYGRSLGQLVYFSKMGLDVPADTAQVPYYRNLWTHFSVEESAETGRGKLMDELERLKPIMDKEQNGAFVVINELFTTAANFDAIEMGKRVLEYLIKQQCKGIYVTHLEELSTAYEGIVSLRATVGKDHELTYHIERSSVTQSTGTNRQLVKYRLSYEQLKERFA